MNKIIIALLTMLLLTSLTACSFSIPSSDGNAQLNIQVGSSEEESKKEEVKEKVEDIDETKIKLKEGVVFENDYITFSFDGHELNNREENDLMLLNFHGTNKQGKYLSIFISAKSINNIPTNDGSGGASTERERTPQLSIHKPKNEDKTKYLINSVDEINEITILLTITCREDNYTCQRYFTYNPNSK